MKIAIIEDDQNKLKQLQSFIERNTEAELLVCKSYQSGLAAVLSNSFHLIVLDMSLPTYDQTPHEAGGRKRPFAGKEILRQMKRKSITTPVLIITQFTRFGEGADATSLKELSAELENSDLPNYIRTIFYSAEAANWETEFLDVLVHVIRS